MGYLVRVAFIVGAAALFAGCGGLQTTMGAPGAMLQSREIAMNDGGASLNTGGFRDLYLFCNYPSCNNGGFPNGSVVLDATGAIYGTLRIGGVGDHCGNEDLECGAVYKLTPPLYIESLPYSFCSKVMCRDGSQPVGPLVFDARGSLYGTTASGGRDNRADGETGGGVVFKLTPSGSGYTESVLYSFCKKLHCRDGQTPSGGVIFDTQGALYGTTTSGGDKNGGVVFKLTPSGSGYTESVLYSFCRKSHCTDGQTPSSGMIFDTKGALYGTTANGGAYGGHGTVFKLTPSGSSYIESILYSFCMRSGCTDGAHPQAAPIFNRHGVLFGTTSAGGFSGCPSYYHSGGCGTVFRLKPSAGPYKESVLYTFCHNRYDCSDGAYPSGVTFNKRDALFGTTVYGGAYSGGLIFKLVPSRSGYKYGVVYYFGLTNSFDPNTTPVFDNNATLYGTSDGEIPLRGPKQGTVWKMVLH